MQWGFAKADCPNHSCACCTHARRRIAAGDYKASRLFTDGELRVDWIEDADAAALRNVNAPEDLGRE